MRIFLLFLLSAVAVIILWAIRSKSYENDLVFALSTLAAGLCAYLLADYFYNVEKKSLKQEVIEAKKEIQVWKDEKDLLQTQFNLATPHAQVEQLEQQLAFADEQRNKLDGLSRAQYAEISGLKTHLEMQKKNYQKLYEESAIATETRNAELMALQDTLASKREKIKYLTDESEYLRGKILKFQTAVEEATIQKVVAESRDISPVNLPKVVIKMPQNGANTEGYVQQDFAAKTIDNQILDTQIVTENEVETVVGNKAIEVEPIVKNKTIEIEIIVENKAIETATVVENKTIEIETDAANNATNNEIVIANKSSAAVTIVKNEQSDSVTVVENRTSEPPTEVPARLISLSKSVTPPMGNVAKSKIIEGTNGEKTPLDIFDEIQAKAAVYSAENTERTLESQPVSTPNSENLQAIQGIDAEIARVLKSAGIDNWQEISETSAERLKQILAEGKIGNVDTSSWSVQAVLLIDGHVNRLKAYLENLKK